jgi:hypothetical protein
MTAFEFWELLSYVVTVIGLPLAIFTFWREQLKERENEDEETYQLLSEAYTDFLKLVMGNPDLQLRSRVAAPQLSEEQHERVRDPDLAVRARLPARLRRRDDRETTPPLVILGRLHARMVPAARLSRHAPAAPRRRRRRLCCVHPEGCGRRSGHALIQSGEVPIIP